jgi:hypothetical protein
MGTPPHEMATPAQIVEYVLRDAGDTTVIVGPLFWHHTDGYSYFVIATCGLDKQFRCDRVDGDADDRMAVMAKLVASRPRVIIDMDDELEMARMCEAVWPGERVTRLRKAVEAERAI